ncbi:MAG: PhnD/SsuA/transferrin family substrate-binding protein [Planctomycetes bacterium]|nr:PhnD/SsuA/transferrin family substrate-binding protein [Planctomycetota bacterium]
MPGTAPPRPSSTSHRESAIHLRALTFLAPGIPLRFYEVVTDYLAHEMRCEISLASEERISGPMHGDHDPFAADQADLGFLCSPSFLYLRSRPEPSIELVPAGFVFRDRRNTTATPVYYSDVIVRTDHPARTFDDLAGRVWGYNDECSLSGHFAALQQLQRTGCADDFFGASRRTGSHLASIDAVLAGAVDAAAIDSTTMMLWRRQRPQLGEHLRVIASWGPFPIQPIVLRRGLGEDQARRMASALLQLECSQAVASALCEFGLERFVPIDETAYAEERRQLCALGEIPD